ncbi:MAG: hypothetical protein ACXVCY_13920 [Pseudobdellovibrionaceae bacterium]
MDTLKKLFLISFGVCVGALVIAAKNEDKLLHKKKSATSLRERTGRDFVDECSEDSFPASDAPSSGPSSSDQLH